MYQRTLVASRSVAYGDVAAVVVVVVVIVVQRFLQDQKSVNFIIGTTHMINGATLLESILD
jgi:hypothetical protein